jgi:hypothetical protein
LFQISSDYSAPVALLAIIFQTKFVSLGSSFVFLWGCFNRNSFMFFPVCILNFFTFSHHVLLPILNHENVLDIVGTTAGTVAGPAGEGNFIRVCCAFTLVLPRHTLNLV